MMSEKAKMYHEAMQDITRMENDLSKIRGIVSDAIVGQDVYVGESLEASYLRALREIGDITGLEGEG